MPRSLYRFPRSSGSPVSGIDESAMRRALDCWPVSMRPARSLIVRGGGVNPGSPNDAGALRASSSDIVGVAVWQANEPRTSSMTMRACRPALLQELQTTLTAITDQRERRPEDGVRVAEDGLPTHGVDERAPVDKPVHGLLQGLGAMHSRVFLLAPEEVRRQGARRGRLHRPVAHE